MGECKFTVKTQRIKGAVMPGPEFTKVELPFIQQLKHEGQDYVESFRGQICAKVEHSIHVVKNLFRHCKVRLKARLRQKTGDFVAKIELFNAERESKLFIRPSLIGLRLVGE
jgi:hypothetical protein